MADSLEKKRAEFVDDVARWFVEDTSETDVKPWPKARALLAAVDAEDRPATTTGPDWCPRCGWRKDVCPCPKPEPKREESAVALIEEACGCIGESGIYRDVFDKLTRALALIRKREERAERAIELLRPLGYGAQIIRILEGRS